MKRIHRFILGMCCLAMSVFGFSAVANAQDLQAFTVRHASSVGGYGAEVAKLNAELAYMAGSCSSLKTCGAMLTSESNGFRLTTMTQSGVAEGMTGVGAGDKIKT